MFTLAHLSDPHLSLTEAPRLRELAGKRMTGFINLARARAANHQAWALDALIADLNAHAPDHVAVTGDLVNIALRSEFANARKWLESLGPPDRISLVPGNHDAYVTMPADKGMGQWAAYMRGDSQDTGPLQFPYLRRLPGIAVIGVSSAIATAPLMATGRVGPAQLSRLAPVLERAKAEHRFRVVLIHHPPVHGATTHHKRLVDARAFAKIIASHGAELILHGHNHTDTRRTLPGPGGTVPVIGVPAASSIGQGHKQPAQYNLLHIRLSQQAACELVARRLNRDSGGFETAYRVRLDASATTPIRLNSPAAAQQR